MKRRPVVLMVLDGFGLSDTKEYNAIAMANTLTVEPKKKVGSLVTYFDVNLYTAGIPVVPQNFWTLKIGA